MAINPTFAGFLEEEPRSAFFGTLGARPDPTRPGQTGMMDTAQRRRQAQDIYGQAMGEFYGKLGEQIMSGQTPDLTFTDFLQDFPFTERFAQMGRQFSQASRYRPRTRFLYY